MQNNGPSCMPRFMNSVRLREPRQLAPCVSPVRARFEGNRRHMQRHHQAIPLHQAVAESPGLARLTSLVAESAARLRLLQPLLPPSLHAAIRPGPIEGDSWCLLLEHSAAAAKLKQLLPVLQARLQREGCFAVIRIKVQVAR
jgi:hypothetical protein